MAIYHCSIKIISRAGGRSAVASAAYRSGEKLYNDETGITHDFTRKGGVILCEIMLPPNAPERYLNREVLWNEVQQIEKRYDAQFAREIEVALPAEMSREEQIECVRSFIQDNFVSEGMIADWALHDKGDGNPHAHIMLTLRGFDEHEKWLQKQKSVFANSRDDKGRPVYDPSLPFYDPNNKEETSQYRIPQLDENGNQKTRVREGKGTEYLWEKISIPANDWNEHSKAELWRSSWAEHCNRYLKPEEKIDHRSYARQGIDKEPTIHEGIVARQMEKEGKVADRCQINREIKERNSIREQIRKIAEEITKLITEKARSIYERYTEFRRNLGDPEGSGRDAGDPRTAAGGNRFLARAAGRITAIKRAVDETEQEIARTDKRIEQLKAAIKTKEESISERFRKLKDRRASYRDGADAGPAGSGEGGTLRSTREDIDSFLRELKTQERASEEKRDDSISKREDRELKQKRSATSQERGDDGRSIETHKRSRGQGLSL